MEDPQLSTSSSQSKTRLMSGGLLSAVFIPMISITVLALVFWRQGHAVQVENGPMENFQAVCLLIGSVLFALGGVRSSGPDRVLRVLIGLFYLTFLVLEVDLRSYDLPLINRLFNGRIRDAWLGGLWILGLLWLSRYRVEAYQIFIRWITTSAGILLVCAGLFWIGSAAVDKLHLFTPRSKGLFAEELLEINAVWLMLVSSAISLRDRVWQKPQANP